MGNRRTVRAAAVQLTPILFDRDGSTQKVLDSILELGGKGVEPVVFPETFIPNYPYFANWRPPATIADLHLRLYVNFLQPVMKLQRKTRHGAKVNEVYDTARTPYHGLLESDMLSTQQEDALAKLYYSLNPVRLLARVNQTLGHLWSLAICADQKEASVAHSNY